MSLSWSKEDVMEEVEALARIGRQIAREPGNPRSITDTSHHGRRADMADSKQELQTKIDRLHELQYSPDLREQAQYKTPRVQKALSQLYTALHGNQPIVGQDQRTV